MCTKKINFLLSNSDDCRGGGRYPVRSFCWLLVLVVVLLLVLLVVVIVIVDVYVGDKFQPEG